jgi:hypothetical protein
MMITEVIEVVDGGYDGGIGLLGFEHSRMFLNVLEIFFVIFLVFDRKIERERKRGICF